MFYSKTNGTLLEDFNKGNDRLLITLKITYKSPHAFRIYMREVRKKKSS